MKKNLIEEIKRIHEITYGSGVITESYLSDLIKASNENPEDIKKVDVGYTADYITNDVNKFLDILKGIDHPLFQQRIGSMERQTQVEAVQIGLELLGYRLPIHGVDGLFGPETASAVNRYKKDNNVTDKDSIEESSIPMSILIESALIHEAALMEPVPIDSNSVTSPFGAKRSYETHPGVDLKAKSGTPVKSPAEGIVTKAGDTPRCGGTIIIKHGGGFQSGYCHIKDIKVSQGQSVTAGDIIGLSGGAANDPHKGNSGGAHLHFTLRKDGQLVNPMNYLGKGGYDFSTSNMSSDSSLKGGEAVISPDMVDSIVSKLLVKNLKPSDLDPYIDKAVTSGGGLSFTDLDLTSVEGQNAYTEICDRFIRTRQPNLLGIKGEMMTQSAKSAFEKYHKYVPPELALAQLAAEGGIGNPNPKSRPIKTRNPFNVGNVDSGANIQHGNVQSGIDAYYNLIARSYLVKGRTASDLIKNFVNKDNQRYASGYTYERDLNKIASQANRIAAPIYASIKNNKSTDNYA
jgi:murein DD-endopeptidase MepM/ murein hydrolase activator NlpD